MPSSSNVQDPSKRKLLKLLGLSFAAAIIPNDLSNLLASEDRQLGRITTNWLPYYETPSKKSKKLGFLIHDDVCIIKESLTLKDETGKTAKWFHLADLGYAPDDYIQPVKRVNQVSNTKIPEEGKLGEISVPYIDAYDAVRGKSEKYRLYYASTYWVLERLNDAWGVPWYRLFNDNSHGSYYVRAYAVRLVEDQELQPVSPEIDPAIKRVVVDLSKQRLYAYEGKRIVFIDDIASGIHNSTPKGKFLITHKRPCRHMLGYTNEYDLPGVPWVSYFTEPGIAFHGAYWHNRFGTPMSHGCINMRPDAAKWIYRWTLPAVPPNQFLFESKNGTQVEII